MTMFASQKINTDPTPWVVAGYARNGREATWRGNARDDDHAIEQADAALPKYDVHTYGYVPRSAYANNPNPLLEYLRDAYAVSSHVYSLASAAIIARGSIEAHEREGVVTLRGKAYAFTAEHVAHARKVFERLVALA